ncbi:FMN-linked oxidoreductase [Piedraia hortae CBS 480.64]|uniref:Dihydroorotate dehydrogenase (quinone), mitochondrial n=1 Tax=Piedraia hortae CBS 480.64 TaxID=1314780 RepID=A0A6A7C9Z9_9PEZI|nr:FMN-linked oxidoreductase [Piedraia hortae CBS 480.64]
MSAAVWPNRALRRGLQQQWRRHQSTRNTRSSNARFYGYSAVAALTFGAGLFYISDARASVHRWIVMPAMRMAYSDAEDAHRAAIRFLSGLWVVGLYPRERSGSKNQDISVEIFGHRLSNPLGISAGFDKNGEVPDALFAIGASIVEVGGVTPEPQEGNSRPRVFRLPDLNGLVNRYGLNSDGADIVAMRLRERVRRYALSHGFGLDEQIVIDGKTSVPPGSLQPGRLLAVQIAKNKTTPDGDVDAIAADYVRCVQKLGVYADILVVNVSSPNTPGLRDLQAVKPLTAILTAVVKAAAAVPREGSKPAVMVKVSPDESSDEQVDGICTAIRQSGVDGVIVGNTTRSRPPARSQSESRLLSEVGGYSGPQTFPRTLDLVRRYSRKLQLPPAPAPAASLGPITAPPQKDGAKGSRDDGIDPPQDKEVVIFASGGITDGRQCLQLLNAGASLCQLYTTMMYNGVGTVANMKRQIRDAVYKE